jgi:hypothetical protein
MGALEVLWASSTHEASSAWGPGEVAGLPGAGSHFSLCVRRTAHVRVTLRTAQWH